jgi:hypothetical protein
MQELPESVLEKFTGAWSVKKLPAFIDPRVMGIPSGVVESNPQSHVQFP